MTESVERSGLRRDANEKTPTIGIQARAWLWHQNRILEQIARREPLSKVLESLAQFFEGEKKGTLCSIHLYDVRQNALRTEAAPSLPAAVRNALELIPVGPSAGSSGAAAYRLEPVISANIASDPLWKDTGSLALDHGLRACWSAPILSGDKSLLGTFTIYAREPKGPSRDAQSLIDVCTGLAALAIERHQVESALRKSEERYRMLFARNLAGVYQSTVMGQILDCNESFARILGYDSPEEVMAIPARRHYFTAEHRDGLVERLKEQGFLANFELCLKRKDGTPVWLLASESYVYGDDGTPDVLHGTVIDISDRKRAEEELQHLAYHDTLTGLPNRLLFDDRLEIAISKARYTRHTVSVFFIDLDRFKLVNDSLGHKSGDLLLQLVGERLSQCVYHSDTVARLGGDEFLVLLPRVAALADVTRVAHKVFQGFKTPFRVGDQDLFVTLSMGISIFPVDGDGAEALVKNADSAMYRAKHLGRSNYQLYTSSMNERALERMMLETNLHGALERAEYLIHFQPVIDLDSGQLIAAEALLRWLDRERGMIGPTEFISVAEETGLIIPLGAWVLRTACETARAWHERGHPLRVAVNLSARQFSQPDLPAQVTRVLCETGLAPEFLDLEITETIAMSDVTLTLETLRALKRLGVRITLDDFGTGYSSFSYLKQFPIDSLKIDRSFVKEILDSPHDRAITEASISMAHGLDLTVIAEGVETKEQVDFLKQHRCDAVQGYYYGRPVSAADFEQHLESSVAR